MQRGHFVCQQRWGDVEAQLQRRADLVPNLVEVVRASARHEEQTLEAVTQARAAATAITLNAELGHVRGTVVNRIAGRPFKPRAYFASPPSAIAAPRVSI